MNWQLKIQETPFGQNTRQFFLPMNNLTFSAGGREQQPIPRVGYLARIHWHFRGTLNVVIGTGSAALDVLGPWNAFNRVRCIANSGQDIYSTSGYGAFIVDMIRGPRGRDIRDPNTFSATDISADVFAAPTAGGNNTWNFGVTLPVAMNEETEIGLVLLQNEMAQVQFAAEYNASVFSLTPTVAPVLVTGNTTATLTGTITPTLEYFAVPADPVARPDITLLHQVLEFVSPIQNTGDNTVNLIRDNIYIDLLHHVILANNPTGVDVDKWRLRLNQSETPYEFTSDAGFQHQRSRFGKDLPDGILTYPLFDQGFQGFGDERDWINGRATSELQSVVTIATGATLGSNPRMDTITRQIVKLQSPPVRQA